MPLVFFGTAVECWRQLPWRSGRVRETTSLAQRQSAGDNFLVTAVECWRQLPWHSGRVLETTSLAQRQSTGDNFLGTVVECWRQLPWHSGRVLETTSQAQRQSAGDNWQLIPRSSVQSRGTEVISQIDVYNATLKVCIYI